MKFRLFALLTLLLFLTSCIDVEEEFCPPPMNEFEDEFFEEQAGLEEEFNDDFKNIPQKKIMEGDLVNFPNLKATDPDGDEIIYSFSKPLDENGEWLTKKGDAGDYKVTITASDGENVISQEILLIIFVEKINHAPVFNSGSFE